MISGEIEIDYFAQIDLILEVKFGDDRWLFVIDVIMTDPYKDLLGPAFC